MYHRLKTVYCRDRGHLSNLGFSQHRKDDAKLEQVQQRGSKVVGAGSVAMWGKVEGWARFSLGKRRLCRYLVATFCCYDGDCEDDGAQLFTMER